MKRATEENAPKRGRGRPPLPAGEERTLVAFRADPNVLGVLDALAGLWGLDRSATIRRALEEGLGREQGTAYASERMTTARTLDLVRKFEQPSQGMTFVPDAVVALEALGASRDEAHAAILALHRAGLVELRPESGLGLFSDDVLARALPGPQGTRLSWARILEGGR